MDEFEKYPFVKHNIDKNKWKKCNPMDIGKYPTIIQNLDNREREGNPDNKEVLEQEAALQQVQMTLDRVSKQLDKVIKHPSHEGVAGGGLPPSCGYGAEQGAGGAAGGSPPQNYAHNYVWSRPLSFEVATGVNSRVMAACKKHDRPNGQMG